MQMLDFVFMIFLFYFIYSCIGFTLSNQSVYIQIIYQRKKEIWCISLSLTVIGIVCLRVLKHKQNFHVYLNM